MIDRDKLRDKIAELKVLLNNGLEFKSEGRFRNWLKGTEDGGIQNWIDQLHRLHSEIANLSMEENYNFMGSTPLKLDKKTVIEQMKMMEKR